MTPAIKICGLTRAADAAHAAASGAAYGGVILAPGGRRSVTPEDAARVLDGAPLRRVGVFVDAGADEVRRAAEVAALDVLQLHGAEPPGLVERLRAEGRWRVWKALRPRDAAELLEALDVYAGVVDGVLLDGYSPAAAGGTGARFPWDAVAPHRDRVPAGVTLAVAGGLHAANVARVVPLLRPDVVDVSSGVESAPGAKDPAAVAAFCDAVRGAAESVIENR